MIKYKMWNRNVEELREIVYYDENFTRLGKKVMTKENANDFPGNWVSPIEVYNRTNGTMGLEENSRNG